MPLESRTSSTILEWMKTIPDSIGWKNHGSIYTRRGVPDIVFHVNSRTIYLETKRVGKKAAPIQADVHRRLKRAGAIVAVVRSKKEAMDIVRPYL